MGCPRVVFLLGSFCSTWSEAPCKAEEEEESVVCLLVEGIGSWWGARRRGGEELLIGMIGVGVAAVGHCLLSL